MNLLNKNKACAAFSSDRFLVENTVKTAPPTETQTAGRKKRLRNGEVEAEIHFKTWALVDFCLHDIYVANIVKLEQKAQEKEMELLPSFLLISLSSPLPATRCERKHPLLLFPS